MHHIINPWNATNRIEVGNIPTKNKIITCLAKVQAIAGLTDLFVADQTGYRMNCF